MAETLTADQIRAGDAQRHEVLRRAQRARAAETAKAEAEYRASLPRAAYDADAFDVQAGRRYVLADERIEVFDGARVWIVPQGAWAEESYARRLGLDGAAVELTPARK